jgi:hypothetical protein
MPDVTIHLPDPLAAALARRVSETGAQSKEEYLLRLLESDFAVGTLEGMLSTRLAGAFTPLEPDWKDRVRKKAASRED